MSLFIAMADTAAAFVSGSWCCARAAWPPRNYGALLKMRRLGGTAATAAIAWRTSVVGPTSLPDVKDGRGSSYRSLAGSTLRQRCR